VCISLLLGWPALSHLGGLVGLAAAGVLAAGLYFGLLYVLRVSEVQAAVALVRGRLLTRGA
jgi:hypothetical protein